MGGSGSTEQVKPSKIVVPRESACEARLNARDDWNYQELDIMKIFKEFDTDKSGFLEEKEFAELLKAYNKGTAPKPEETQWMLKVADKNHDGKISRRELMYAMQAWFGYTHLSDQYSGLFDKYDVDHNGYLDQQEFLKLLTELNEGKPVDPNQAQVVLAMADQLGDGRLGRYELLGAVGIWYVSVGRKPTPEMQMTLKAMQDEPSLNICAIIMPTIMGSLTLGFGIRYRENSCKADLDTYLIAYGVLALIGVPFTCLKYYMALEQKGDNKCLAMIVNFYNFANFVGGTVIAVLGIMGVSDTWDEADREACGTDLWWTSCVLFVMIPIINLSMCCCGLCCLCCVLAVAMRQNEAELHEDHQALNPAAVATTSRDSNSETKPLMAGNQV